MIKNLTFIENITNPGELIHQKQEPNRGRRNAPRQGVSPNKAMKRKKKKTKEKRREGSSNKAQNGSKVHSQLATTYRVHTSRELENSTQNGPRPRDWQKWMVDCAMIASFSKRHHGDVCLQQKCGRWRVECTTAFSIVGTVGHLAV